MFTADLLNQMLIFIGTGLLAGLLAGCLRIGGGLVVVPLLSIALPWAGVNDEHVMVMSIGTALATIVFTSAPSLWAQNRRLNVVWPAVFSLFPGIMLGSLMGAAVASQLASDTLSIIFALFALIMVFYIWFGSLYVKPTWDYNQSRSWLSLVGFILAKISSIVGVGGGTLLSPWLIWLGLEPKRASGTSAACGSFIAVFGGFSYIVTGANQQGLPDYALGYIYLPAFLGIIMMSVIAVPLGIKLSTYISAKEQRIALGIAMLIASAQMLLQVI